MQPNIGVVKVPDERLDKLAKLFDPKKFTLADIRYIDFPGDAFSTGQGPSAQFLAQLARCDALIHVVARLRRRDGAAPAGLGRRGA